MREGEFMRESWVLIEAELLPELSILMNEVIEREAVFEGGLGEQTARESVGDDVDGHDDVIGDAAVVFGVAVADKNVVEWPPPEGFVGVGSHHHFVRETEES